MITVEKDQDGIIWITSPRKFAEGNRVANIERCDKSDVWSIEISDGTFKFFFSLVISPKNTEEKMIQIAKDLLSFVHFGVYYQ